MHIHTLTLVPTQLYTVPHTHTHTHNIHPCQPHRYLAAFSQAFGRFVQQQVASPDCTPALREANLAFSEGFRNIASQLDRLAGLCNVIAKEAGEWLAMMRSGSRGGER